MSSAKSSNRYRWDWKRAFRRLLRPRPLRELPLLGGTVRTFQDRLTARGRFLFLALGVLGLLGLDTRTREIYVLFSIGSGLYMAATIFGFRPAPRASVESRLPARVTAGRPVRFTVDVTLASDDDLFLAWIPPRGAAAASFATFIPAPRQTFFTVTDGRSRVPFDVVPSRRGRYVVPGPRVRRVDPLGLIGTAATRVPDQVVLVYPRFYAMETFDVPLGRRYQPGGIPLTSSTGDAIEFVGTREYRPGDAVRNIHWRSWARRGEPVIKEYQEEYFCRIAVILDTFLKPSPTEAEHRGFEAAISVVSSIADYFSRSEYIVDVLAAGPDVYEVSAGRSLGYLENILDVLSCVEACYRPPFETIGPQLFDRLAGLTTVVAVLQDWDEEREAFLRRVRDCGVAVRAIVVHDGQTSADWRRAEGDLGQITAMSPADVSAALGSDGQRTL
jgi:uncharacterized protein (DUF58 family)